MITKRQISLVLVLVAVGCTPQGDPAISSEGLTDSFDRDRLGELWNNTGGPWEIRDGQLHVRGAKNRPLWLRRVLPQDVSIEFDVRSESPEGDIKAEVFGDGVSKAKEESYTATSYVVIFGGWNNSLNVIARMNEHGNDRIVGPKHPVVKGKTYHVRIERQGKTLSVQFGDALSMKMRDPDPLYGRGHDHFAFNNWKSDLWFDNLRIKAVR